MNDLKKLLAIFGYRELARQLGISERQCRRYFNGDSAIPYPIQILASKILNEIRIKKSLSGPNPIRTP